MRSELLVVGSGLTGATIARLAREAGHSVTVVERRAAVGGNVRDERHASGIVVHSFGPHFFRTSSERIWRFVTGITPFRPFAAEIMTVIDGALEHWPVTRSSSRSRLHCPLPLTTFQNSVQSISPKS